MKLLFTIIFCVFIIPNALCEEDLQTCLKQITDLFPIEKFREISARYREEKKQYLEFEKFKFEQGPSIALQILQDKEFLNIYKYIEENSGFFFPNPNVLIEKIAPYVVIKPAEPVNLEVTERSVNEYYEELFESLPKDELSKLMKEKMETCKEFKKFMDAINGPEFSDLVDKFKNSKDLTEVWATIKSKGLDLDDLHTLILKFISLAY